MVVGMHIMEHAQSILSNDSYHIEYFYVDRNDNEGIFVKRVVMQGFPACIFWLLPNIPSKNIKATANTTLVYL